MKCLDKIKNYAYRFLYALPFSMRGGEIFTSSSKDLYSSDSGIERHIEDERLSDALLRGEITKEVADMRYRDYTVSENARDYEYVGGERGKKVKANREFNGRVKMHVENKEVCSDVKSELDRVDTKEYGEEKHILKVKYSEAPRFRIEGFCLDFDVKIGYKFGDEIKLHFSDEPYFRKPITKAFINHMDEYSKNLLSNGVFDTVSEFSFVTYKIDTEKDYVKYTFKNLLCNGIEKNDNGYSVYYTFKEYERENLTDKFKVEDLEEKYKNKEPKKQRSFITEMSQEDKYYYKNCGKEISPQKSFPLST